MKREDIVWRTSPYGAKASDYDVNISYGERKSSKAHRSAFVRFGLLNRAKNALCATEYLLVSSVFAIPDRIYFMNTDANTDGARKINCSQSKQVVFTVSNEELEEYKRKWVGSHKLRFDMESQLHYIESGVKE